MVSYGLSILLYILILVLIKEICNDNIPSEWVLWIGYVLGYFTLH